MKLLILILGLIAERYMDGMDALRSMAWYERWEALILKTMKLPTFVLLFICILPLPMLLGLFHLTYGSGYQTYGIFTLIDLGVLILCLGPASFYEVAISKQKFNQEAYFEQMNAQWFAPILWYIFSSIEICLLYRLVRHALKHPKLGQCAQEVLDYMDWVPTRLMSLMYMLAGNFQNAMPFFVQHALSNVHQNRLVLTGCAIRAMKSEEDESASAIKAQDLVWRAMILVLTGVALTQIKSL